MHPSDLQSQPDGPKVTLDHFSYLTESPFSMYGSHSALFRVCRSLIHAMFEYRSHPLSPFSSYRISLTIMALDCIGVANL